MRHKIVAAGLTAAIAVSACIGFAACKEENLAEIVSEQLTADQWNDAFPRDHYHGGSEDVCVRWTKHSEVPEDGTIIGTIDVEYEAVFSGELLYYSEKCSATGAVATSDDYINRIKNREMYFRYAEKNSSTGTLYKKTDGEWTVEENTYDHEIAYRVPLDLFWKNEYNYFTYDILRGGYIREYDNDITKQTTILKFRGGKLVFAVLQTENAYLPDVSFFGNEETAYSYYYGDDVPEITLPRV